MYIRMIKRRIGSIVIALMAVLMLGACSDSGKEENYMMINAEKAKEMMDKTEEFVLLDVRSREEFSLEHIPGAIVIPHDEIIAKAEGAIKNKDMYIAEAETAVKLRQNLLFPSVIKMFMSSAE